MIIYDSILKDSKMIVHVFENVQLYKLFGIISSFELMASISGKANITLVFIYFVVAA